MHFIFRGAIITPLSITALSILKEAEVIANRDHSLDGGITQAAYEEFLSCGYQKASLHKIAEKAGVTTGAIYTRYKNKDALFASLLQGFMNKLNDYFAPVAAEYDKAKQLGTPQALLDAINYEERIYVKLLTECCDECTLFFCRSGGSSVEALLHQLNGRRGKPDTRHGRKHLPDE